MEKYEFIVNYDEYNKSFDKLYDLVGEKIRNDLLRSHLLGLINCYRDRMLNLINDEERTVKNENINKSLANFILLIQKEEDPSFSGRRNMSKAEKKICISIIKSLKKMLSKHLDYENKLRASLNDNQAKN